MCRSRKILRKSKKWLSSHIGGPRAVQKNIGSAYFRAIYHGDQLNSRSGGATTDDVAACFWDPPFTALSTGIKYTGSLSVNKPELRAAMNPLLARVKLRDDAEQAAVEGLAAMEGVQTC